MAFQATSWKRSGTVAIARAVAGSTSSKPRRRQRHSRARWSSGDGLGFLPGTKMILFLQIASVTVQLDPRVAPRGDFAENVCCAFRPSAIVNEASGTVAVLPLESV